MEYIVLHRKKLIVDEAETVEEARQAVRDFYDEIKNDEMIDDPSEEIRQITIEKLVTQEECVIGGEDKVLFDENNCEICGS